MTNALDYTVGVVLHAGKVDTPPIAYLSRKSEQSEIKHSTHIRKLLVI